MDDHSIDNPEDFPRTGFRARRWQRFERDLHAWLGTPEGRFVSWAAHREVTGEDDREVSRAGRLRSGE
jgi:hypothetical protein